VLKAKLDDLRGKLQMLEQSASLPEQCSLFERAALWAQFKKQKANLEAIKHNLQVITCRP
jgi:hypothetical protein